MIVYSINDRDTFLHIDQWKSEVDQYATAQIPLLLVATKSDKETERKVSYEEGLVSQRPKLCSYRPRQTNTEWALLRPRPKLGSMLKKPSFS